ncbi:MAG: flavodoxin-dependent (E)-4-hydroxy-3-methylbut-2-enyl-diphosphate synthase [Defluviitaleaceae bacterium]|nr:flavodoxin-dependent (E)-4-hydroxy-3-methylbut-2-enyl-diphosphate synthase [Defluviitaleaceae bacterium]MCL2274348.1 flavodoxin-dependent (E)-4-hydroxy-3-methylbut-2-enyl-diphosphate synthase [Defluviitaleaceae bacterium]
MITRDKTRVVHIGGVPVGGGNPIVVQSMTNTNTRNIEATVAQIHALEEAGCEIVRVAVPDTEAADALREIKKAIHIPLVADIHFDHRLALAAIKNGADKLRINPGNIGGEARVRAVAQAAKAAQIPIRVGVNGGSLEKEILAKYNGVTAEGLAESALLNVAQLERNGFNNIVVSVKASSIPLLVTSHKILAEKIPYPLHIGLTEAGTPQKGTIRSAAAMGALLSMGIGDTIRISLAGDPTAEIPAAREILAAMGLRPYGVHVIACPTCGRCKIDVAALAARIEARTAHIKKPLTIAVMGCEVNGPGEAREADIGITGGKGVGLLFKKGEVYDKLPESELEDALLAELRAIDITPII